MMALQNYIGDFKVFGSDYPTPDDTAIRDYVHVADLAEAHVAALHVAALRRLLAGDPGGRYNLGIGQGYSVKNVLDAIERETGERLPAANGPRRPGDPAILIADSSRAREGLGFCPAFSDLSVIVRTAWAWHRRRIPDELLRQGRGRNANAAKVDRRSQCPVAKWSVSGTCHGKQR